MFHFKSKWVIGLLIINCLNINKLHIKSILLLMIRSPTNQATSNSLIQLCFIHLHLYASRATTNRVLDPLNPFPAHVGQSCYETWRSIIKNCGHFAKTHCGKLVKMKSSPCGGKSGRICLQKKRSPWEKSEFSLTVSLQWITGKSTMPRRCTNTNTSTLFPLKDARLGGGKGTVLTLIERDKAQLNLLYSFFLNSAMMGVPGQCFREIWIRNRIKLKATQQQATTQTKTGGEGQDRSPFSCWTVLAVMLVSPGGTAWTHR